MDLGGQRDIGVEADESNRSSEPIDFTDFGTRLRARHPAAFWPGAAAADRLGSGIRSDGSGP